MHKTQCHPRSMLRSKGHQHRGHMKVFGPQNMHVTEMNTISCTDQQLLARLMAEDNCTNRWTDVWTQWE